ncbi:MAG TPA: cytochrome c oxidase accessory protein CcoG [Steroidobacteraceae bacterium]|nr:cytochrome c oxidase accessory protein CcoG [Steroidobacteraceae bacterium]
MNAPAAQDAPTSFYEAHKKIYPREIGGRFQRLRNLAVWVLLGLYYLLPWIPWDGRQSVLFDLPARKFYVFGLVFWPQDFFYLTWLLIILGLSLFFFTALAGRLWCGYACPQTVWTDVFMSIERRIEGDRNRRLKLDRGPWTGEKILRKGSKHVAWLLLALWTGFTFVGFFTPIQELATKVIGLSMGPWETFWVLFYSLATWGNAGFMREQVCKYMCPYARFQSAMFDRDTLIIAYDTGRGEPRGARARTADYRARGLGECIDCKACVQVCPTGIDIREGLQYECIACAACIDACDAVMDKMSYPRGLVRYTSQKGLEGGGSHMVRPRMIVYGGLLAALVVGFFVSISLRTPVGLDVMRDRNALYRKLPDGAIENVYLLRILNKDTAPHRYVLAAAGLPGIEIDTGLAEHRVGPGEVYSVAARVRVPAATAGGSHEIAIEVASSDAPGLKASRVARFLGP